MTAGLQDPFTFGTLVGEASATQPDETWSVKLVAEYDSFTMGYLYYVEVFKDGVEVTSVSLVSGLGADSASYSNALGISAVLTDDIPFVGALVHFHSAVDVVQHNDYASQVRFGAAGANQ